MWIWMTMAGAWAHGGGEHAHQIALSVYEQRVRVKASPPVSALPGFDTDGDGRLSAAEVEAGHNGLVRSFVARVRLLDDEVYGQVVTSEVAWDPASGGRHVAFHVVFAWDEPIDEVTLMYALGDAHPVDVHVRHGQEITTRTVLARELESWPIK